MKSLSRTMHSLKLAAEQGDAGAQYNLGVIYDNGRGVAQDDKEAARWFGLAAKQGHADAPFYIGVMYTNGQGVAQDDKDWMTAKIYLNMKP